VTGVLAPRQGVTKILAQQAGVIRELHVREGAMVDRNQALLALVDARAGNGNEALGGSIERQLEQRRHALAIQRRHTVEAMRSEQAGLDHRRRGLARELAQLDTEIELHSRRMELARLALDRWLRMEASGFVSTAVADREREAAFDVESRLEATRRTRLALARELDAIDAELRTSRARGESQLAAFDVQAATLDQERVER
jgi:membrane fusion protein